MNTPLTPYIGVTGITHVNQPQRLINAINGSIHPHRIMCGIVLSNSLIQGRATSHPNRYPPTTAIPSIFNSNSHFLNLVHYRPDLKAGIAHQLDKALQLAGPNCHGIQVNTPASLPWTPPEAIAEFTNRHPSSILVIQIGVAAFQHLDHDHAQIADLCSRYPDNSRNFIIDLSGGNAIPMNIHNSANTANAIMAAAPDASITFAGGISHQNVSAVISQIRLYFPHPFSIDAEGALRTSTDLLDLDAAATYISEAARAFNTRPPL